LSDIAHGGWVLSCDCVDVDGEDYLKDDDSICYIETRGEWYLMDDCRSDYNGDMIHEDDAVELCNDVYEGDYAYEDDASKCIIDGEYYLNDDMIEVDGGMLYEGNQEHYNLILENLKPTNNETKIA
jgi:hypothetical protein